MSVLGLVDSESSVFTCVSSSLGKATSGRLVTTPWDEDSMSRDDVAALIDDEEDDTVDELPYAAV